MLDLLILVTIGCTDYCRIGLEVLILSVSCSSVSFVLGHFAVTYQPVALTNICLLLVSSLADCVIVVELVIE